MFTINIYVRFALIAIGIIGGVALWAINGFWYGFPLILIGVILLAGYLMLGTIMSTNQLVSKGLLDEAEQRLKLTFFPKMLLGPYRGVYPLTYGAIALQRKDLVAAERYLKQALDMGLPSENERGAAVLQLAVIAASKNNRQVAQNYMADLKKMNITEPILKEQIRELEKNLKQMQQSMNPSMMALMGGKGFRPGSKRPRPKMR